MSFDASTPPAAGAHRPADAAAAQLTSLGSLASVFAALPSACLLLTPSLHIAAVSEAYLAISGSARDQLLGKSLFDAFGGALGTPEGETMANLRASLQQVLATGQAQEMPVQAYRIADPAAPDQSIERFWQPLHSPVLGEGQAVAGIIHTVTDVTAAAYLRESQAREQAAYAEAERQRTDLLHLLEQTPVAIGIIQGPDFVVEQANPALGALWGRPAAEIVGRPFFEALPDLRGQGFEELFAGIRERSESLVLREVPVHLTPDPPAAPAVGFYDCVYQPWGRAQNSPTGFIAVAVNVTEQVLARQQVEDQERQTQLLNEELRAANAEMLTNNAELECAQQRLRQLNEELEARVQERTQALLHAQGATEQGREQLYQVFEQMPVAIAIMRGPNLRVELANPAVAAIWGREPAQVLGRPYFEAVPDTAGQGFEQVLANVLATGQPFTITEAPVTLARAHKGLPQQAYVNFVFQPLRDAVGRPVGLIASGIEVTEQVLARQQVQLLNQELATSNEALEARVLVRTQEVQAAQAQAEAERATLQRVFEQAPLALAILEGPSHVITFANAEMGLIWGRSPATLRGHRHFEALPDLAGQGFEAIFADVYHTGRPYYLRELPVRVDRAGDGNLTLGYYHITYQPLRDGQGHITAITASALDVTDQVLARQGVQQLNEELETRVVQRTAETQAALQEAQAQREQLRAQQALLSQILGQVPASVATLSGPEHRYSFFNDQYQALSGGRTHLGLTVAEVFPEVVAQGFVGLLDQVYATGQPFIGTDMPAQLYNPLTGRAEQQYVDFIYQPLTNSHGQTQGILAFIIDTTDRVRARLQAETLQAAVLAAVQRQKEERENVFQLFEQSPAVICLLREPEHRIDYLNPAYQALFPGQQLRGRYLAEVQPETVHFLALLDGIYRTGLPQFKAAVPMTSQGLEQPTVTRYFDFTYQAYREQERIAGVSVFGLDVTAQVLARGRVQELNEELAAINGELLASNEKLGLTNHQLTRTNADLDTFVYTASHDLKVPIANIEGLLDALGRDLREQPTGDSIPHIMSMMQEAVSRFQQTIGHLTDISRLQQESGPAGQTGRLAIVLADVQLDLAPLIDTTGAHITAELADSPELPLSPKNLRSVVYNLLSNALKYRAPGRVPVVRVQCWQGPAGIVLEVQDNGLGLDERQQKRLFGLFQRLHTHVDGSGVGLYMVKKIVENAGGTVRVHSQAGVGSTFVVTLPAAREHSATNNA